MGDRKHPMNQIRLVADDVPFTNTVLGGEAERSSSRNPDRDYDIECTCRSGGGALVHTRIFSAAFGMC